MSSSSTSSGIKVVRIVKEKVPYSPDRHKELGLSLEPYTCHLCTKKYEKLHDMNMHKKDAHGIGRLKNSHNLVCGICHANTSYRRLFLQHLREEHDMKEAVIREAHFGSLKEFLAWKGAREREQFAEFIVKCSTSNVKFWACHRSGSYQLSAKKKVRKKETIKVGYTCSAFIKSTLNYDESVDIDYCLHHYKHDFNVKYLRMPQEIRQLIAEFIREGATTDEILSTIRQMFWSTDERAAYIQDYDVRNVLRQMRLEEKTGKRGKKVAKSATARRSWLAAGEQLQQEQEYQEQEQEQASSSVGPVDYYYYEDDEVEAAPYFYPQQQQHEHEQDEMDQQVVVVDELDQVENSMMNSDVAADTLLEMAEGRDVGVEEQQRFDEQESRRVEETVEQVFRQTNLLPPRSSRRRPAATRDQGTYVIPIKRLPPPPPLMLEAEVPLPPAPQIGTVPVPTTVGRRPAELYQQPWTPIKRGRQRGPTRLASKLEFVPCKEDD